jgi:hypothetical protein
MTALDVDTISKLLERPPSAEDLPQEKKPISPEKLADSQGSEDDEGFADLEPHPQPTISGTVGGQLLDLSKMLEVKKKQQEEKRKRVEAIKEKER